MRLAIPAAALRVFTTLILLGLVLGSVGSAMAGSPDGDLAALLQGDEELRIAGRPVDRALLAPFYAQRAFQPIWDTGRRAALSRALDDAESQGLDAGVFIVPQVALAAERDVLLTDAFLRYAAALATGRVAPTDIEIDWKIAAPPFDPAKLLDQALERGVDTVLAELVPQSAAYQALRAALKRYRDLASPPAWRSLSLAVPLKPGASGDGVAQLRARLAAEGIVAEPEGLPSDYDAGLAAAVKRFQDLHGLPSDGSVGRATLAALNVSPASRLRQIRVNLERWRSLPRDWAARRIEVNVPAASATLYEDGAPVLAMRAIVGAAGHPTPVLRARLLSVLFNPPWRVPSSIIENEIKPAVKRDRNYLKRNDYAYVDVNGVKELQQLPGPKNALGKIKFEMPNLDDIYLHDTPARALFERSQRALSHGCVRLEEPRALAFELLGASADTDAAIDQAISTGGTRRVSLPQTLPVYIFYATAFVDADGAVEFRDDVYGRDRRLAEALAARDAADHLAVALHVGGKG